MKKHTSNFSRLSFASIALLFLLSVPALAVNELGAYEKGVWNSEAVPEFSIVLFRWGTKDTELNGKDRILGQVASLNHTSFTMVLQTLEGAQAPYEMTIKGGVQIYGEGRVASCTECPHTRKYNGTTLVSRSAYVSDVCCFVVDFDYIPGVPTLKVVDMKADGRSVPYMIKFTTDPIMSRNGLKVPVPGNSRLHEAGFSLKPLEKKEKTPSASLVTWPATPGADEETADHAMKMLSAGSGSPVFRVQDNICFSGPMFVMIGNQGRKEEIAFSIPDGDAASLVVEGPGFRLRGMNDVRAFAMGLKSCFTTGESLVYNPPSIGKPIPGVAFPSVETTFGAKGVKSPVQAVLLKGKSGAFIRLETIPSGGGEGHELFTTKIGHIPGLLKLFNPQTPLVKLAPK